MKKLELLEGEMICPKCNGTGVYYNKYDISTFTCSKCLGEGKLDWIENIVGKQNKYNWGPQFKITKVVDLSDKFR